ncbi:MAG: PQQ-binding-like beta-propeller repeat protein [Verrucomicrobiota bacterium]
MNHITAKTCLAGSLAFTLTSFTATADWPQYRGANTDGISTEAVRLPWAGAPKHVWTTPTTSGLSSFSVGGGKAFTVVKEGTSEVTIALDANTGKQLWKATTGNATYQGGGDSGTPDNKGGDGPRSTPAVDGSRVYVYSADLVLHCLDANSGKSVWTKDIMTEFGGRNITWKSAISPVIDGNLVYVAGGGAGQSALAFNKTSGQLVWKALDDKITHATPAIGTIQGVRQVIFFMQSGLVSLDAATGNQLWRFAFPFKVSTAASPVICGNIVYCSAGYGVGGGACEVSKGGAGFSVKELYKVPFDQKIANHWSTPVYKNGYLYGMFSFKKYGTGPMKCVDVKTGQIKWEQPNFGAGNVILAGNNLLALADDGQLVAVEASPNGYKELARTKAVDGKCWSTPALSDGRVYIRSTKQGVCLDLR